MTTEFTDAQLDELIKRVMGWHNAPSTVLTPEAFPAWYRALSEDDQDKAMRKAIDRKMDQFDTICAILDARFRDYQ